MSQPDQQHKLLPQPGPWCPGGSTRWPARRRGAPRPSPPPSVGRPALPRPAPGSPVGRGGLRLVAGRPGHRKGAGVPAGAAPAPAPRGAPQSHGKAGTRLPERSRRRRDPTVPEAVSGVPALRPPGAPGRPAALPPRLRAAPPAPLPPRAYRGGWAAAGSLPPPAPRCPHPPPGRLSARGDARGASRCGAAVRTAGTARTSPAHAPSTLGVIPCTSAGGENKGTKPRKTGSGPGGPQRLRANLPASPSAAPVRPGGP